MFFENFVFPRKRFENVFKINEKVPQKLTFEILTSSGESNILGGIFFAKPKIFLKRFRGESFLQNSVKTHQKMLLLRNWQFSSKIPGGRIFFSICRNDRACESPSIVLMLNILCLYIFYFKIHLNGFYYSNLR